MHNKLILIDGLLLFSSWQLLRFDPLWNWKLQSADDWRLDRLQQTSLTPVSRHRELGKSAAVSLRTSVWLPSQWKFENPSQSIFAPPEKSPLCFDTHRILLSLWGILVSNILLTFVPERLELNTADRKERERLFQ